MAEAQEQKSFEDIRADIKRVREQNLARQNRTAGAAAQTGAPASKFDTNNPLYRIWMDLDKVRTPAEKQKDFVKFMTIDETKTQEENAAIQEQISDFMFFLQRKSTNLSRGKLLMEDPKTTAFMNRMFKEMTGQVNEYKERFAELDGYLSAVFNLRTSKEGNITFEVAKEITTDIDAEAQRDANIAQTQEALKTLDVKIEKEKLEIKKLENKKRWFFLKDERPETLETIATKKSDLKTKEKEQQEKTALLQELNDTPAAQTAFPDHAGDKQRVRESQAMTFDQHVEKVQGMIKSLVQFIDDSVKGSDELRASLKEQLKNTQDQITEYQKLFKVSKTVVKASLEAAKANQAIADKYSDEKAPANETQSAKEDREENRDKVQIFIDTANNFYQDTTKALAALTSEGIDLDAAEKNVLGLMRKVSTYASSGIASVASRLATHVSHFQTAVATESLETMRGAANELDEQTMLSNQSQAVQQANRYSEEAQEIQKMIERERQKQELSSALAEMKESGMGEVKEGLAVLMEMIQLTDELLEKNKSIGTNMDMQDSRGELKTGFDENAARPRNDNGKPARRAAAPARPRADDPGL